MLQSYVIQFHLSPVAVRNTVLSRGFKIYIHFGFKKSLTHHMVCIICYHNYNDINIGTFQFLRLRKLCNRCKIIRFII